MLRRNVAALFVLAAMICGLANVSRADTVVTATLVNVVPFYNVNLSVNGNTVSGAVGKIFWDGAGFGNPAPFSGDFTTFCLDLSDEIGFSTYTFTLQTDISLAPKPPSGPMGVAKADEMEELFSHYSSLSGDDEQVAFQLAIWNIVYDTDTSVQNGDGNFYVEGGSENPALDTSSVDSSAITLADLWLQEAANPANQIFDNDQVEALTGGPGVQDQILVPVPLPTSVLCSVLLGACVLVTFGRRAFRAI